MNRRDALKAAIGGAAACVLPAVAVGPVLTNIDVFAHWANWKEKKPSMVDVFASFSDGSHVHVVTNRSKPGWFSLLGKSKVECLAEVLEGYTYWHKESDNGRWVPVGMET